MANLRPYGPGKYDTMLDAYIHDLSMNGCDEECGDTQDGLWYGLLRGIQVEMPFSDIAAGRLTDDELAFLRQHRAGAILSEDSQGFVTVDYFTSQRSIEAAWHRAVKQAESALETD